MQLITVRKAKKDDVGLIANLSWQTFFDTYAQHNTKDDMELYLSKSFSKEAVSKDLSDKKVTFLLAYIKREIVGYARLYEGENPAGLEGVNSIEITRLYSVKNKIGSGVGKELMQHIIDLARSEKKSVLWLGVWSENQRAMQFYRKFGFEKFGDSVFMLGNDAQNDWLMKLDLTKTLL